MPPATNPTGWKPSSLVVMVAASRSASRLAPTIRVRKVSLPSRRMRRTCQCHSRRTDRARTSPGPRAASSSRENEALDQNDTMTVAEMIRLMATMMRRNSSAVEYWWTRYSRMVR